VSEEVIPPTIVYVDENEDAREDFYIDARKSGLFHEVIILAPEPSLEDMVNELLQIKFEALISDFRLADASPADYDGNQLVEAFLRVRSGFPCFIRTSYDNEALHAADDVNRVYSKEVDADGGLHRPLFERINLQILRHRRQVSDWSEELEQLLAVDRSSLVAHQIDRIVELDALLEAQMGADHAVAQTAKKSLLDGNLYQRQSELLAATEDLIAEIRHNLRQGKL